MENKDLIKELLNKLEKQEEINNKKLMASMWTILAISISFYIIILFVCIKVLTDGALLAVVMTLSTIILLVAGFISLKFELDAGYYECKKCHNKFVPTYKEVMLAPHMATTRYLKCSKCLKRTWAKKKMSRN